MVGILISKLDLFLTETDPVTSNFVCSFFLHRGLFSFWQRLIPLQVILSLKFHLWCLWSVCDYVWRAWKLLVPGNFVVSNFWITDGCVNTQNPYFISLPNCIFFRKKLWFWSVWPKKKHDFSLYLWKAKKNFFCQIFEKVLFKTLIFCAKTVERCFQHLCHRMIQKLENYFFFPGLFVTWRFLSQLLWVRY